MIYNGISGEGEDPFYPSNAAAAERMDTCMMHPANEVLHYHAAGSCAADTSTSKWELEIEKIELQSIVKESWKRRPFREVFGLSFDGRPIYSPYYNNGKLYEGCDVDICNGLYIDGEYSYVSTIFHPYIMGCYGPGSNPGFS